MKWLFESAIVLIAGAMSASCASTAHRCTMSDDANACADLLGSCKAGNDAACRTLLRPPNIHSPALFPQIFEAGKVVCERSVQPVRSSCMSSLPKNRRGLTTLSFAWPSKQAVCKGLLTHAG